MPSVHRFTDARRRAERATLLATRCGFTLIEMLVAIAIVAALIGLLLPGVQKVREAASRAKCANNLHNLALAAHSFNNVYQRFPSSNGDPSVYLGISKGWIQAMMPQFEQAGLFEIASYGGFEAGKQTFPLITCPSDPRGPVLRRTDTSDVMTSYAAVTGTDSNARDGIMYDTSLTRPVDVQDGLSQTLLLGERPPLMSQWLSVGFWYNPNVKDVGVGADQLTLHINIDLTNTSLPFAERLCLNHLRVFKPGSLTLECDANHLWSVHPDGGNFAFGDGAVRFIRYSAALTVIKLATRTGGETVDASDY